MAGIEVSSGPRRRASGELPLVPFIDVLLCLISFLLLTAAWTQMSRLEAFAATRGDEPPEAPARPTTSPPELHIALLPGRYEVSWQRDGERLETADVSVAPGKHPARELTAAIRRSADAHVGRTVTPVKAVVHSGNALPFGEVAAVLDSLHGVENPATDRRMFAVQLAAE